MTWSSEHSAVPRFVLAKSAIHCRFVDRFAGSRAPSLVSIQWFSPRGVSLPSLGSRRARFPDVAGTMKALRLPACACLLPYLFGRRSHVPSFVRVRRGALDECEGHSSSLGQEPGAGPAGTVERRDHDSRRAANHHPLATRTD